MTASVTGSPREVSASRFSFCRMRAEISCGVYRLPSISLVFQSVPMCRLTLRMVRSTLVTAWFLADWPTRTSPFLAKATTEGVVRDPSELAMTVGSPPSRTVTTELVVPRSIPTARAMELASLSACCGGAGSDPVVDVLDLASGPLNFPAQPNGTPAPCVPHPGGKFSAAAGHDQVTGAPSPSRCCRGPRGGRRGWRPQGEVEGRPQPRRCPQTAAARALEASRAARSPHAPLVA